jgi:hypothetical protein
MILRGSYICYFRDECRLQKNPSTAKRFHLTNAAPEQRVLRYHIEQFAKKEDRRAPRIYKKETVRGEANRHSIADICRMHSFQLIALKTRRYVGQDSVSHCIVQQRQTQEVEIGNMSADQTK